MTLIQALRQDKPLRLKNRTWRIPSGQMGFSPMYVKPESFLDPTWLLSSVHLTKDWEIKNET